MIKLAQTGIPLYDESKGGLEGFGPLGTSGSNAPTIFNKFLTNTVGIITVIGFIWFLFLLVTGAIGIMTAGGDKNAVQNSAKKITNGLIGLIVLISAIFLIQMIGKLLGIEDIILNPAKVIIEKLKF